MYFPCIDVDIWGDL